LAKVLKYLQEPLTYEEIKRRSKNGENPLSVVIRMGLDTLMSGNFEDIMDEMSELITGDACSLTDIGYTAVGAVDGDVLLEVTGDVSEFLEENNPEESEN